MSGPDIGADLQVLRFLVKGANNSDDLTAKPLVPDDGRYL